MSTFVFYNPKTNTIERKQQTSQPNTFQMPYMLNIQPQDLNYAMRNTSDLRSYPPFVQYPDNFDKPTSNKENYSYNMETKKASAPIANYEKSSKEFLMMEDLHEDDIGRMQQRPKFEKESPNKYARNEQRKFSPKKSTILKPTPQPEDERKENFNLMNQEDLMLKYKPEDYSINERILNARFVQEEQERTRKFVLNRMASDIQAVEARANVLEKEIQSNEQEAKELEAKTQKIWQEIERKKFDMKANEIFKRIDEAVDYDESEQENRFDDFYRENEALYDEINQVLGEDGEEESAYVEETDVYYRPAKPKNSGYRSTSASRNNALKPGWSVTKPGPYAYKPGNVKPKLQKSVVKTVGMSKPSGTLRPSTANRNAQKTTGQNNNGAIFKNPKKVEDALQRARAIVDQY